MSQRYGNILTILEILLRVQYENHVDEDHVITMMNALARATA